MSEEPARLYRFIFKSGHVEELWLDSFSGQRAGQHITEMKWNTAAGHPHMLFVSPDEIAAVVCVSVDESTCESTEKKDD